MSGFTTKMFEEEVVLGVCIVEASDARPEKCTQTERTSWGMARIQALELSGEQVKTRESRSRDLRGYPIRKEPSTAATLVRAEITANSYRRPRPPRTDRLR